MTYTHYPQSLFYSLLSPLMLRFFSLTISIFLVSCLIQLGNSEKVHGRCLRQLIGKSFEELGETRNLASDDNVFKVILVMRHGHRTALERNSKGKEKKDSLVDLSILGQYQLTTMGESINHMYMKERVSDEEPPKTHPDVAAGDESDHPDEVPDNEDLLEEAAAEPPQQNIQSSDANEKPQPGEGRRLSDNPDSLPGRRYEFISPYYMGKYGDKDPEVLVMSSESARARRSAEAFVRGLFPDNSDQMWAVDSLPYEFQNIPIVSSNDYLRGWEKTSDLAASLNDVYKSEEWAKLESETAGTRTRLELACKATRVTRTDVSGLKNIFNLADHLLLEYIKKNKNVKKEDVEDAMAILSAAENLRFGTKMPSYGKLLTRQVTSTVNACIANSKKVYPFSHLSGDMGDNVKSFPAQNYTAQVYVAHYPTMLMLLADLGIEELSEIPQFGSAIAIELVNRSNPYIRVRYLTQFEGPRQVDLHWESSQLKFSGKIWEGTNCAGKNTCLITDFISNTNLAERKSNHTDTDDMHFTYFLTFELVLGVCVLGVLVYFANQICSWRSMNVFSQTS